jgi:hypothetical protein
VTQNAGTNANMDLFEESEHRVVCEEWYENNLCLLESEHHLAAALAQDLPGVVFLQEIWHATWCDEPDRPDELQGEPYACAGEGEPLERGLPAGYPRRPFPTTPCSCSAAT